VSMILQLNISTKLSNATNAYFLIRP